MFPIARFAAQNSIIAIAILLAALIIVLTYTYTQDTRK